MVYDNGIGLRPVYQGRNFPEYLYEESLLTVLLKSIHESDNSSEAVCQFYDGSRKGAKMHEKQLLAYLKGACPGRTYRVSSVELERTMGISGTDLRKIVNRLRRKGIPIASDRNGYFYAQTASEVYSTIRQLQKMSSGRHGFIKSSAKATPPPSPALPASPTICGATFPSSSRLTGG